MIAPHNVITALTVAELASGDSKVIKANPPPLLIYLVLLSLVGLLISAI